MLLDINIEFDLDSICSLYQWKGRIYPLLNRAIFIEIINNDSNEIVQIENYEKFLPITPHKQHIIKAKKHIYPKPFRLLIKGNDGKPFIGCLQLRLTYDTFKIKPERPYLNRLLLRSNVIETCNKDFHTHEK